MTDRRVRTSSDLDRLSFPEDGLIPVVAQDVETGEILMLAFANREALIRTLQTGEMHYWSRSRRELWRKGATSGNTQALVSLHRDCDADALLARVLPRGPACHTGESTCFGALLSDLPSGVAEDPPLPPQDRVPEAPRVEETIPRLWTVLAERARTRPPGSYTVSLLEDENLRLKKLGEETAELVTALARGESGRVVEEGADLVYHLLTALLAAGVELEDLLAELDRRRGGPSQP